MKHYFETLDSEICYSKAYFLDIMKETGVKKLTVFDAIREIKSNFMYCEKFQEVGEKGHCGKDCEFYKPRNKISGNCLHTGILYEHGNKITLKL